jgi:hypothetical protein
MRHAVATLRRPLDEAHLRHQLRRHLLHLAHLSRGRAAIPPGLYGTTPNRHYGPRRSAARGRARPPRIPALQVSGLHRRAAAEGVPRRRAPSIPIRARCYHAELTIRLRTWSGRCQGARCQRVYARRRRATASAQRPSAKSAAMGGSGTATGSMIRSNP